MSKYLRPISDSSASISTPSTRVCGKNFSYARDVVPAALPRIATRRGAASRPANGRTRWPSQTFPVSTEEGSRGPGRPASHSASHTECSAWPSFSSSVREWSGYSITRAYWYSVSASWITRPPPSVSALSVPTGSAISAAIAVGASAQRRTGRRPQTATMAIARAKIRKVRRVPTSGIRTSAESSVPSSDPAVESAYSRPATVPASSTEWTASRIAHGETVPSSSTGIATRTTTASSEPTKAPAEISSSAFTATSSSGSATKGTRASITAAESATRQSARMLGWRSARRPPSQYPTESATSTVPIVFAHTIVEAPKYGASRRTAAISAPSEPVPTTKTSSGSGGIYGTAWQGAPPQTSTPRPPTFRNSD